MTYYPPIGNSWRHLGFNPMTANSTAKTLTDGGTYTIPVSSQLVRLQPEDASIRWRADGTSPTANTGNLMSAGDVEYISGRITTIQIIRATASNAAVNVNFSGRNL